MEYEIREGINEMGRWERFLYKKEEINGIKHDIVITKKGKNYKKIIDGIHEAKLEKNDKIFIEKNKRLI